MADTKILISKCHVAEVTEKESVTDDIHYVYVCTKCKQECEVESVCAVCLGTGVVDTYYRGDDTGYNYVVDGTKPCICQAKEHDGDGPDD